MQRRISTVAGLSLLAVLVVAEMVGPAAAQTRTRTFQCTLPDRSPVQRIVGGQNAQLEQYPWQVSIARRGRDPFEGHFCGGILIGRRWVMTAAHCMVDQQPGNLVIRHGISNLRQRSVGAERGVTRIVVHPDYNKGPNDIALVKLDAPIAGARRSYATLPRPEVAPRFVFPQACGVITGWGTLTQGDKVPSHQMQAVSLPIVDQKTCREAFAAYGDQILDVELCAGLPGGGKDSCLGDSGGPLVVEGGPTGFVLAGIVSWGRGCAQAGVYGVYARVSKFIPWVVQVIRGN